MAMRLFSRIIWILMLVNPICTYSQKVGVVLSGGGAKGYAHVGLIRALEENHIPIDYICGTSIGAIVAGLYAIGYTPDQMEELLGSEQFYKWSQGLIDINEEYYYKLKNEQADWLEFEFKKDGNTLKPQLPTNVIGPEQMDLRFMQFYAPGAASAQYDFNKLFVPFFCVASDVHRNLPVICRSGDLATSIRASMTFPGYFRPISMDNTLLFDGGMENNFPADLMKEFFNPDVIIGCKVSDNPAKPTADDIYLQLENVFMKAANFKIPGTGILIEPNVMEFGIMDFDKYFEIAERGYEQTMEKMDSIRLLVNRRQDSTELANNRQQFVEKQPSIVFDNIYINGADNESTTYILKNIKRNRRTLTFREFEQEYFKLLSDKLVQSIYPRAVYNSETGYYDIDLDISTKNSLILKLGGNLSSSYRSMGLIGVDYVFQKKNIYNLAGNMVLGQFYNSLFGHFRIDFPPRMIKKDKVLSPFYVDLILGINRWDYFKTSGELFIDSEGLSQVIQSDRYVAADLGMPIANRGLLYGGFSFGEFNDRYFQTTMISKDDIADKTTLSYTSLHSTFEYSTLNYKQYASAGAYFKAQVRYITGLEEYLPGTTAIVNNLEKAQNGHSWINFRLIRERYFYTHKYFTLGYMFCLNLSDQSAFSNQIATLLSAPVYAPFPQSRTLVLEKYRATNWVGAGLIPLFTISDKIQLRGELHAFQPYKYIYTKNTTTKYSDPFPTPRVMGNMSVIYQTPIGPFAITGSYYYKEETPFYFQVNLGYILFNRKGLD